MSTLGIGEWVGVERHVEQREGGCDMMREGRWNVFVDSVVIERVSRGEVC